MDEQSTINLKQCELCGMVSQKLISHYINEEEWLEICEKCWYNKSPGWDIIIRHRKEYMRLDKYPAGVVRASKVGEPLWMLTNPSFDEGLACNVVSFSSPYEGIYQLPELDKICVVCSENKSLRGFRKNKRKVVECP